MADNAKTDLQGVYLPLRLTYGLLPVAAGLDKFTNLLADWQAYLPSSIADTLPVAPATFMQIVGVIEIVAGLTVLAGLTRLATTNPPSPDNGRWATVRVRCPAGRRAKARASPSGSVAPCELTPASLAAASDPEAPDVDPVPLRVLRVRRDARWPKRKLDFLHLLVRSSVCKCRTADRRPRQNTDKG